ncbi:hypothetical protein MY11210_008997 [Beauveria gryllotalpidicola]
MKLSLLSIAVAARTAGTATTGNAEVDVIFPRNDTFALTPLLPVVFAVQNPAVAQQLNLRLHYRVIPYGHSNTTTEYERLRLDDALPSNDTTFYVHDFVAGTFDRQGTWEFFWQLRWNNCTAVAKDDNGTRFARDAEEPVRSFVFTTRKGGSKPDLVALSSGEQCGNTQAIAFEVQDVLNVPPPPPPPQNAGSLTSCAHVAVPAPTPTPCSAAVPSEAAQSISSRITEAACLAASPGVSCPAGNASGRTSISVAAAAFSLGSALYALSL